MNRLADLFKQCHLSGRPAIIILEEIQARPPPLSLFPNSLKNDSIQEFARAKKQVLLYALTDLMHKSDLFFVVIGTSSGAFFDRSLEKRISSRLNPLVLLPPRPRPADIFHDLFTPLVLPVWDDLAPPLTETEMDERVKKFAQALVEDYPFASSSSVDQRRYEVFREEFNGATERLARLPETPPPELDEGEVRLLQLVRDRLDWGLGFSHFMDGLEQAMMMTGAEARLSLRGEDLARGLAMLDPSLRLARVAGSLSLLEIHLLASVTRLTLRPDPDPKAKKPAAVKVEEAKKVLFSLRDRDRDSALIHRSLLSLRLRGFVALDGGPDLILLRTVRLVPHPALVQDLFREGGGIVVAENIRRAVLQPELPLSLGQGSAGLSLSLSHDDDFSSALFPRPQVTSC